MTVVFSSRFKRDLEQIGEEYAAVSERLEGDFRERIAGIVREIIRWESSVEEQRKLNVHVHDGIDEEAFVAMRKARDATLAAPTLILPSLQVNIQGGALPAASRKGP